ncbi:hypothetical protein Csa_016388 [Cucumis sativus]|uniref:Uncharacterized protein n=1 Tax=Cucumis sativus TaxID=3659 RepID=A0A0A0K4T3_CUCSA|nr:hypothetical protein Csa_016388 [Cucumis sativus]
MLHVSHQNFSTFYHPIGFPFLNSVPKRLRRRIWGFHLVRRLGMNGSVSTSCTTSSSCSFIGLLDWIIGTSRPIHSRRGLS